MNSGSELRTISLGNMVYLDRNALLDILAARATLIAEELRRRGTSLADTEFLRGQSYENQVITNAIQPPTQVS